MSILCVETSIKIEELKKRAKNQIKDRLIKAVVDVEKGVMAIGGAMHCDEESVLLILKFVKKLLKLYGTCWINHEA